MTSAMMYKSQHDCYAHIISTDIYVSYMIGNMILAGRFVTRHYLVDLRQPSTSTTRTLTSNVIATSADATAMSQPIYKILSLYIMSSTAAGYLVPGTRYFCMHSRYHAVRTCDRYKIPYKATGTLNYWYLAAR